jgi:hypothetical protein
MLIGFTCNIDRARLPPKSWIKERAVDLSQWMVGEIDDITTRLRTQVLQLVPPSRRRELPGGGSPILWRPAGRACRAAWWRVAWAAVLTVAAVVMLAGAVWLAAFVAAPGW